MISQIKNKYFMDLAKGYGSTRLENCFKSITIDSSLMNEIKELGGLNENQEFFIHEMIKRLIHYAELGFVNGKQKINVLIVSRFVTWGNSHETNLIHHIEKYNDIIYTEFLKDYEDDSIIIYPKGTIIGTINDDPFPAVEESIIYRELLDPNNYGAPHYVLDFVNKKLNEALSGHNLWAMTLDFDYLSIYDLTIFPHIKTY